MLGCNDFDRHARNKTSALSTKRPRCNQGTSNIVLDTGNDSKIEHIAKLHTSKQQWHVYNNA